MKLELEVGLGNKGTRGMRQWSVREAARVVKLGGQLRSIPISKVSLFRVARCCVMLGQYRL